ncbi:MULTISPECIES: metallophosphoesterase [unclassified Nocardioides]|uniref:metallophosphoesterase family protein n=1 Tax=unclassified Nocardioides TaxID=2615069 RepID=UPI00059F004F|nr:MULTISPECIES: metallophosphoesterase [unclassified Nocardioides]
MSRTAMETRRAVRTLVTALAALGVAALLAAGVTPGADASPSTATGARTSTDRPVLYPRPVEQPLPSIGVALERPVVQPDYRFLSSPDFMNSDIADVSKLRTWHRGLPNSWNSSYAATVDTILDTFESEAPEDVFVAGDLVEGHWVSDDDRTGLFGPARTHAQRKAAIRRAADFYFSEWRKRFDQRGLPVYAAVGDHDIGDNPWRGGGNAEENRFKRDNVELFKASFSRKVIAPNRVPDRPRGPAHDTAYATYVDPEVLLVTVDVFEHTKRNVVAHLDRAQLAWLDRTLASAERRGTDWIVVQGHVPVLKPVRIYGSSAMYYRGGAGSAFWRTMARHHVDLYLDGEVHDISVRRRDGITQISHGGTIQMASAGGYGSTNYLLGEVFGDTMFLRDHRFAPKMIDFSKRLWQVGQSHRPVVRKEVWDRPLAVGHLVLTSDNQVQYSDGALIPLS